MVGGISTRETSEMSSVRCETLDVAMHSSAECGYTQSVCGHTGAGLRQATRMRIAHVRMWAVAREYIHTADHPDGQSEG